MKYFLTFFSLLAIFTFATASNDGPNVVCYFTSWTIYRPKRGLYNVTNLPADLCTHVHYAFIGLNEDGTINNMDPYESRDLHEIAHLRRLRSQNPKLKLIMSMGGWNEGSQTYSQVTGNPSLRGKLIQNIIKLLIKTKFDGFDLDWEYPAQRGGTKKDVKNFVEFLGELNKALKSQSKNYLLSVAVSGGVQSEDVSYDYKGLEKAVDYINVMTYDYHGDWETYTGHFAPLYGSHLDKGDNKLLNVDQGFTHWIVKGVTPNKLNLGIGTYGRTFTLRDPSKTDLYSPTNGPGKIGPYTEESGMIGYNELCEFHPTFEKSQVFDQEQQVPHVVVDGNQWIGFESIQSVTKKAKYGKAVGAGGLMIWSLDTDDFRNTCGKGKYPLINAAKSAWSN